MPWSALPAASLNCAPFTPKMSHVSPANCFVSLHVKARKGHWKESYGSRYADFNFRRNKRFIKACSSAIFECIAAAPPVGLILKLKEIEGKPQTQAKKMDVCKGKRHNNWARYHRHEPIVLANTTRASHNLSETPISVRFAGLLAHSTAALQQPLWAGGVWRAFLGTTPARNP